MKDEDLYDPRTSKYYYSKLRLYFNLHELAKKVEITKDIKNLLNYLEKSLNTYALDIYATGQGNCYRYAAAFAYLARELGYTVRVATGQIAASRGGVTPHAWVEINVNGSWLICDPDMEDAKRSNYYMRTYSNYPVKPLNKEREWPIEF